MKSIISILLIVIASFSIQQDANASTTKLICNNCDEAKRKSAALDSARSGVVEVADLYTGELHTYIIEDEPSVSKDTSIYYDAYPDAPNRIISVGFNSPATQSEVTELKAFIDARIDETWIFNYFTNNLVVPVNIPSSYATSASQLSDVAYNLHVSQYIHANLHSLSMITGVLDQFGFSISFKAKAIFSDGSIAYYILTNVMLSLEFVLDRNSIRDSNNNKITINSSASGGEAGIGSIASTGTYSIGYELYRHCFTYIIEVNEQDPISSEQCYYTTSP